MREPKTKLTSALQLNEQYFSFTSTEMNLEHEEAKEKESCEKSASEESRLEMSNSLWQSYTMASKPKFLEDPQYIRSAS